MSIPLRWALLVVGAMAVVQGYVGKVGWLCLVGWYMVLLVFAERKTPPRDHW